MQNFKITNIHIGETYGGVLCYENLRELNERFVDQMDESVAVCFGDDRKIYKEIEHLDLDKRLPNISSLRGLQVKMSKTFAMKRERYTMDFTCLLPDMKRIWIM